MAEYRHNEADEIFAIARAGDLQNFQDFFAEHPDMDINVRNEDEETLLVHCVKRLKKKWKLPFGGEFAEICELLIERGINVDLQDMSGNSAVYYAVESRALDIAKLLVKKNARLDIPGRHKSSALDVIAQRGELDWVRTVYEISSECDNVPSQRTIKSDLFRLFLATKNESCIWWICEHYPEVIEKKDKQSLTPLHIAVVNHNVDALTILLEFNANIEVVDSERHTPIHYAVEHGYADCLLLLLTNGADVNWQDADGASPLHYAVSTNLRETFKYYGNQVQSGIIVECLLSYGASVTLPDNNGRLPLHWAANAGNANACQILVSKGCPVNATSDDGLTALHIAASRGYTECMRVLVVDCCADVNMTDKNGHTSLLYALSMENIDCAELLMCHGISSNISNTQGSNPVHYAASYGLTSALEILHKYEASLELEDADGNRPLHQAISHNQLGVVDYLLKCNCNVNARNKEGHTPLQLATIAGSVIACDWLVSAGAKVNDIVVQEKDGHEEILTALDLAHSNSHIDCEQFLKSVDATSGHSAANLAARKIQKYWKKKRDVHRSPSQRPQLRANKEAVGGVATDRGLETRCKKVKEYDSGNKKLTSRYNETEINKNVQRHSVKLNERQTTVPRIDTNDVIIRPRSQPTEAKPAKVKIQSKQEFSHSTGDSAHRIKQELKGALKTEMTRTEKLTREVDRLKENLATRTNELEDQLKEVELKLRRI